MDTIKSIKCIYRIKKEDINKDIQIINNGYYNYKNEFIECNKEIKNKIKIMIDGEIKLDIIKYKFNKEGEYTIYILEKESIKDMSYMFYDCKSLKSIDLSNFNINNVHNMSHMFDGCDSLESINLANFNTKNVINMSYRFSYCKSLKAIDLSNFNTNNVNNMSSMFFSCNSLESIDLSNFNICNVTDMANIFYDCNLLNQVNYLIIILIMK